MWRWQDKPELVTTWVDSDFAGCRRTGKSTSGGVLKLGDQLLKTWSITQGIIALSSGEAEYYGLVKGSSVALGIKSLLEDLGVETKILVNTDASAAKGIASRRGLGKVRHTRVQQVWLQERVNSGEVKIRKVPGRTNMADAFTKALEPGELEFHMKEVDRVGARKTLCGSGSEQQERRQPGRRVLA